MTTSRDLSALLQSVPPAETGLPASEARFEDGSRYRIEIPSVEGPDVLAAVIEEATELGVAVHRCSQGSGVIMLSDADLNRVVDLAQEASIEVSLFARPTAEWSLSAGAVAGWGGACLGVEGLAAAEADVRRATDHGIRSVLLSDFGLLAKIGRQRDDGRLPADLRLKSSVLLAIANPATAALALALGADTLNLTTDVSLADIAAIRAITDAPIDLYVEAPDDMGGFVRLPQLAELVRVAAPVYLKFGLRNAAGVYPSGAHLRDVAVRNAREKVHRARIGLDLLAAAGVEAPLAPAPVEDLAVPVAPER